MTIVWRISMLRLIIIIIILKQTYVECLNLYFRAHTKKPGKISYSSSSQLTVKFFVMKIKF